MDQTTILAWASVAQTAIQVGLATVDSIKGFLSSASGVADDDPVLDQIVAEATVRMAARQAEADKPVA